MIIKYSSVLLKGIFFFCFFVTDLNESVLFRKQPLINKAYQDGNRLTLELTGTKTLQLTMVWTSLRT